MTDRRATTESEAAPLCASQVGPVDARAALLTVGGIGNDLDGPSSAYVAIADALGAEGVSTLRLLFRCPGDLAASVDDVLAAIDHLTSNGAARVVLLGWSFGGAVVIRAGAAFPSVVGVATVATQGAGAEGIARLAPRSVLLVHGTADPVLPSQISERLHAMAGDPKRLVLYDGDGHALERSHARFVTDFLDWARPLLVPEDDDAPPA